MVNLVYDRYKVLRTCVIEYMLSINGSFIDEKNKQYLNLTWPKDFYKGCSPIACLLIRFSQPTRRYEVQVSFGVVVHWNSVLWRTDITHLWLFQTSLAVARLLLLDKQSYMQGSSATIFYNWWLLADEDQGQAFTASGRLPRRVRIDRWHSKFPFCS